MNLVNEVFEKFVNNSTVYFPEEKILQVDIIDFIERRYSKLIKVRATFQNGFQDVFIKIAQTKGNSKEYLTSIQDRVQKEFEILKYFYDKFGPYPDCSVVKPIVCYPEFLTLITEYADGRRLAEILWQDAKLYPNFQTMEALKKHCFAIGRWLSIMQKITQGDGEKFDIDTLIEDVDIRLKRLIENPDAAFGYQHRKKILKYFESQKPYIADSDQRISGVHGDFCPGNILINGNKVIVLDFNMFTNGSIYHDLSHLFYHFDFLLERLVFRRETILELQKAFLSGYDAKLDGGNIMFNLFRIRHALCDLNNSIKKKKNYPSHKRIFYRWFWKKRINLIINMCSNQEV